ncbi:hypothetical protein G3I51_13545 [Streptomyces sp. SID9944]|nr:hypothetical protein [Streptomyces sp. SID9944]
MTTTLAAVLALAAGWTLGYRARHRAATDLERAVRPAGPHAPAIADEMVRAWQALEDACCLTAWTSRGQQHDPAHCTRKGTTA